MPALKLRIPSTDAPKYGDGNLSQLAKAKLLEALSSTGGWPRAVEPSSALPASAISVWLSNEQHAAVAALAQQNGIPGAEPMATALLHGWALTAEVPAPTIPKRVPPPPPEDEQRAPVRHSVDQVAADLERKSAVEKEAAMIPPDDLPWAEDEPAPPLKTAQLSSTPVAKPEKPSRPAPAREPRPATPLDVRPLPELPKVATSNSALDRINAALGSQTRPAQAVFFQRIHGELLNRQQAVPVIAAEAATGIGKTRVFLAAMMEWTAQHPEEKAVLTAPSYNVLLQAVRLWTSLRGVLSEIPDAVTLLGQQEFVSRRALEHVLESKEEGFGPQIRAWMADGAPAPRGDHLQHPWLMRSLLAITGGNWVYAGQCRLEPGASEDDPGLVAYQQQFKDARDAPWVFCTHAMLATELRRRIIHARNSYKEEAGKSASQAQWEEWQRLDADERKGKLHWQDQNDLIRSLAEADIGRLPEIGLLVVDEAHLLEESFARLFATGASIASLMRSLSQLRDAAPKVISKADIHEIGAVWDQLKNIGAARAGDSILATEVPAAGTAVAQVRRLLSTVLKRKLPEGEATRMLVSQLRMISRSLDVAAASNGDRSGMATRISWSPSAHWPSIEVGRYDVSRELDFLWTCMVRDRAILVSATLFDDVAQSGIEGMRRLLAVRSDRLKKLDPVRPQWVTEPVTLYLPKEVAIGDANRSQVRFYRPWARHCRDSQDMKDWWERWRREVSAYVASAYRDAKGGTLVLLTAHQEREAIHQILEPLLDPGCLISQREGVALDAVKRQYLRVTAEGRKPLLLAVGAAWTGLDISGDALAELTGRSVRAEDDNVLTDLVIVNAPIGANRTLTHQWRRERNRSADLSAATIMLRQGIGRLVRQEGLPRRSRRLHFLDTRLYDVTWNSYFTSIRRVLSAYTSRREI